MRFLRWLRSLSCNFCWTSEVAAEVTAERTSWGFCRLGSSGWELKFTTVKFKHRWKIPEPSASDIPTVFGVFSHFGTEIVALILWVAVTRPFSPTPGVVTTFRVHQDSPRFTKTPRSMRRNRTVVQLLPYLETASKPAATQGLCHMHWWWRCNLGDQRKSGKAGKAMASGASNFWNYIRLCQTTSMC